MAEMDAQSFEGATGPMVAPNLPVREVTREAPKPEDARRNLVKQMLEDIKQAEKKHEKALKRICEDEDFAYKYGIGLQWPGQVEGDERYIANIVQRHVNTHVAALYARNPKVVARPARRREFQVWDGSMQTAQMAMMAYQNSAAMGALPDPQSIELLMDIQQGMQRRQMIKNVGDTLEILYTYYMREQIPDFKEQMKQLVRRVLVAGVGFVKLGYQRLYDPRMDHQARIDDVMGQIQTIERMRSDVADGQVKDGDAEIEDLRLTLQAMQNEPEVIVREGLCFDFPAAKALIIDKNCRQIKGFIGARWIAEKFELTDKEIEEIYNVDLSKAPESERPTSSAKAKDEEGKTVVYHRYDRKTGLKYCFTESWPDFLVEPAAPEVKLERFFPYYVLAFNAVEHRDEIYPPSDVRLLRHQQIEYNRIKESLRQHRIANRPLYAVAAGKLESADTDGAEQGTQALDNYPAHAVIELQGMEVGEKVNDIIQPVQKVNIDPNLYESEQTFADMERVSGSQEANLGGTSNSTATESNIAEGSRISSLQSNADDLDVLLSQLARDGGQVLLLEASAETVTEIVGPGAVWPELSRSEIVREVFLEIEAGSSGRPNKAVDIANFKEMGPLMLQMPGNNIEKLNKYMWKILDDKVDPNDMLDMGMPSVIAMNGMSQLSTGDPSTDPNAQGAQGANNAPAPAGPTPGPALPSPAPQAPVA
jgi:hypothetical protein